MAAFHVHKQYVRNKSNGWVFLLIPLIFIFMSFIAMFGWYTTNIAPLSDSQEEIIITVEVGRSAPQIGRLLEESMVIKSATAFDIYTRLDGSRNNLQAGGYKLSPSLSVAQIVEKLVKGDVATDLITILPAQRIDQIRAAFLRAGFSRDEIIKGFDPKQYADHPALQFKPIDANLEGYLYPETYQRTSITTVEDIIVSSLNETATVLTSDIQQQLQTQGLGIHEAIILASIIEKEVPAASGDRNTVAQVYLKRLREGILLQADPTAQYGALLATGTQDGWRNYDSPYNTYIYPGLPPGPISNISQSSIQAVANPTQSDYLFFVADDNDDNVTHFARTLQEHEQNIRNYCRVKCSSY
jgi:UPF0755 protein